MNQSLHPVLEAGISFLTSTFANIIADANRRRVEEKRLRKSSKKNSSEDSDKIVLNSSEKLVGTFALNIADAVFKVNEHCLEVKRWSDGVKFRDLEKSKKLGSVYIQLDTFLIPANRHMSSVERERKTPLEEAVLGGNEHCVILGQPGAGKSTSLKKVSELVFGENTKTEYSFPILLRFRDLIDVESTTPILDHITSIIPFEFRFNENRDRTFSHGTKQVQETAVFEFLNHVRPILILDGFDELKDSMTKSTVLKELQRFSRKLNQSKLIVSCRTGEFNHELSFSNTFEIAPLTDDQIELFVTKWLKDENKTEDFLNKVKNSPFSDTSIKPLSLAHLCAIYERIGTIPDQPKEVYRKVVNLLVEEWDEQRLVIRESAFGGFQSNKKFEFLCHLAFYLTTTFKASTFNILQFEEAYRSLCADHNLPIEHSSLVVKELESHTGLFIESGYKRFDFVHKSIQEFLAASYIVKLPSPISVKNYFESLGAELAIAVSISSNSSVYFTELILHFFLKLKLSDSFYSSFLSRLVAENPDLNEKRLVSVSSLVLLSNWISLPMKSSKENIVSLDYDRISSFESFSNNIDLAGQKSIIQDYYEYKEDVTGGVFVELRRTKKSLGYERFPSRIRIPFHTYTNIFG